MLELSKKNKEGKWITPRAEQIANDFLEKLAETDEADMDADEAQLYLQSAGGFDRKGRVYGTCVEAPNFFTPPNQYNRSSSQKVPRSQPGVVSQTASQNAMLPTKVHQLEENQKMMIEFMRQSLGWQSPPNTCNPGIPPFRRDDFSSDHGDGHGCSSFVPPT